MKMAFLAVQILHLLLLQVGRFEGINGAIGPVDDHAADHIPKLAPIEGLSFTGFGELEIDDHIRLFLKEELESLPQIAGIVHDPCPLEADFRGNIGKANGNVKGKAG
jgi:hypothetical protein